MRSIPDFTFAMHKTEKRESGNGGVRIPDRETLKDLVHYIRCVPSYRFNADELAEVIIKVFTEQ